MGPIISYRRSVSAMRKPQRLTITVPWRLYQELIQQSNEEGRSLSSLASYWLELQSTQQRTQAGLTH